MRSRTARILGVIFIMVMFLSILIGFSIMMICGTDSMAGGILFMIGLILIVVGIPSMVVYDCWEERKHNRAKENKMKIQFNGKTVEGKVVEFTPRKEDFNEYQLMNGVVLKMKNVVTQIIEIVGEKTPEGQPVYQVRTSMVFAPLDIP